MRIDRKLIMRLLCVAVVAAVMLPAGRMLLPYVGDALDGMQFKALEAMVTAALGYALSALVA